MDASGRRAVGIALATQAVAIGSTFGAFSLFVQPLEVEFAAARWEVSLGPALMVMALAIGGVTVGGVLDRGDIRRVMLAGAVGHALALAAASQATSLPLLAVLCVAGAVCIPPLGPLGGSTLVGRSVGRAERGRALGIMNMGAPLGGLVFASLAGFGLESLGWRGTLLLFAVVSAAVNVPAALLVPHNVGLANSDAGDDGGGWEMPQLVRSPTYLMMAASFAIAAGGAAGWASQLAPYLAGLGADLRTTALVVAAGSGLAGLGTLVLGALADRWSSTLLMSSALGAGALCFAAYATEASVALGVATALVFGALSGGFMPLYTHLVAERFGTASLGRAMGLTNLFMLPVSMAASPLAAASHDASGSYRNALVGFVLAYALAIALLVASGRGLAPDKTARPAAKPTSRSPER